MEFNFKISDYKIIEENLNEFKSYIEQLKDLLKANEQYKNLYQIFSELRNKNIYLYFILFKNYENWINVIFENNNNIGNINKIDIILKYIKENKDIISDINSTFIYWIFYLYNELIKNFNVSINPKYHEINKIVYAIKQTSDIIVNLYKFDIINDMQIFDFLFLIFFFTESNFLQNIFSDKVQKGKSFILFSQLFFLLQEIIIHFNNKLLNSTKLNNEFKDKYKTTLSKLCMFFELFKNNKEITSPINKSVLINNNILINFMNNILAKINLENIEKYESNFINILSEFFLEFIKHNYKRSKIYDSLLFFLRQSFINLYNFEKNKIIQDLYIHSFYSSFLKKLFFRKEILDYNLKFPDFDCFYFNGYDSQISLNIQGNKFEKSSLFFSFNLNPIKGRNSYPLFLIQNSEKKQEDILKIYLKKDKENNFFNLCEYHENKEKKFDYIIKSNTTYYLCVCFNDAQLIIKLRNQNKDTFSEQPINKKKKLLSISSILVSFGYYKKKSEVFSGYIGPIMILSNPKESKCIDEFTTSVLNLGKNYINYIPICLNLDFIEGDGIIFITEDIGNIDYKIDKVECLLYLLPKNFTFFNLQSGVGKRLSADINICPVQENYFKILKYSS